MEAAQIKITTCTVKWLAPILLAACLTGLWQWAIRYQAATIIPGPWAVVKGIAELARNGLLFQYVVASLFRVTWGYLLAVVTAIPIGLHLGWHRRAAMALNPPLQMLRPISPLAWIPLAILWFGVGDLAAIFLIFLASFLPLTVSAMNAVGSIPAIYLDAGRNFGLSPNQVVYKVLYPAVMPQLIVGLRLAFGIAWLVVVAAEMVAVNSGLGFLIIDARNAGNRYDLVIAGMLLIGVIGFAFDAAFRRLERLPALRWGYESL
ncbi:MAG: ABC transporter permease [Acidobacteria bacterium]|nr:ABC transporter permease [Acidobacteriota bacterium]